MQLGMVGLVCGGNPGAALTALEVVVEPGSGVGTERSVYALRRQFSRQLVSARPILRPRLWRLPLIVAPTGAGHRP